MSTHRDDARQRHDEQQHDEQVDSEVGTTEAGTLSSDERDEALDEAHVRNWNNGPGAGDVPEWMRRRNDDEDTSPEHGQEN